MEPDSALKNKRILVLGGTGHLGSNLIHHLVDDIGVKPEQIRVFYLKGSPVNGLEGINNLDLFEGNVLNSNDVNHALEAIQIVFHLIGSTTFNPALKKMQWQINVEGTRNVLEAVKNSPDFEKLCYVSTVNVLAPLPNGVVGEIDQCSPYRKEANVHSFKSPEEILVFADHAKTATTNEWIKQIGVGYYDSKLAAQELVNYYVKQYGINAVSVLPGTMFGPYDYLIGTGMYIISLYHGQMPAIMPAGLLFTHVKDVAEGMIKAIERGKKGEMYILSGKPEDNRTLKDMAAIITEELQFYFPDKKFKAPWLVLPYKIVYAGAWLYEKIAALLKINPVLNTQAVKAGNYYWYFTHKKTDNEIGYTASRTFREGVKEMIAYYDSKQLFGTKERYIDKAK